MGRLVKGGGGEIVGLFHAKGGGLSVPKPFEHEIFLFDTHVAGTSHIEGIRELEPHLNLGDKLDFFREPDNPFDSSAIAVKSTDGVKIGYVPKADNVIFSRLMDAGKLLFARITSKAMAGKWLKLEIKVFCGIKTYFSDRPGAFERLDGFFYFPRGHRRVTHDDR